MAERDIDMEVYVAIKAALLTYAPFTSIVPEGNRIWFDDAEGLTDPEKDAEADGDFHESILWNSSGEDDLHTGEETLSQGCNSVEHISLTHRLQITSPYVGLTEISKAGQHAIRALRRAEYNLGVDFIRSVRVRWVTERVVRDDTQRWTHTIDIFTESEFYVNDLK